ncbi:limbin-like isoform X2 [Pristis pectinata]|uniref:limbin-like isoform X2 n=1 Tax=Pristis pectinata TaxID=685728 RepID=UPI00223D2FFA|nr:limbin-like isoform X2 [Pristis pectinata]
MKFSVWLLLFTALSHTLHSSARAGTMHPLTNASKLLSPMFQVKRRIGKGLQELPSTSSLHLLEQNEPPGRGCRNQLYVPLADLGTDQKCLDDQSSLQHELTADSSGVKLYGSAHTHLELGILSQEHHNHPLSSAASGSMWSQSVFFSLLTWSKPVESPRKRELPQSLLKNENTGRSPGSSAFNLTFQKCAEVNGKTLTVKLMINNLDVQSAFNVSQLTIQDSINVLSILDNTGNETEMGFQTYTKESLQGEHYIINYTAVLKAGEPEEERNISLPAYLTIGSRTQGSQIQIGPLKADFILMMKAATQVSLNHGFHFAGFIIAFIVSFAMVCLILITIFHVRRITDRNPSLRRVKRRHSDASSSVTDDGAECLKKNIRLQDRVIDILLLEDPQNMTHALDDLYVSNIIQLDTVLEYHRKRMNLNAIVLLLRNFKHNKDLSPFLEERFNMVFRAQFEQVENSLNTEHTEMLAILAAQSNQETRHKMEALYRKQEQEDKEAELLMQNVEDEVASQWRKDLEQLHMLEQQQLKSLMSVTHEEASANAQREMVVRLRQAFQKGVYDQLKEVTRLEELDATSGRQLLQESWHIQFQLEILMDQQLAFQRKLLEESLAIKRNLVKRIQCGVDHRRYLLNTAALHIADLIRLVKNAGYLTEGQVESLLEMVHQEILVVKLRLDEVMDQEKKLMQHKLVSERRKHIVRRIGEHERQEKELASLLNTSGERTYCHNKYLMDWHELLKKQAVELGELVEKLDEDALDQLEVLREQLTKDISLRIKKIHTEIAQKLLNFGVPKDYLKQMADSQEKETNLLHEKQMKQEENEKHKANESLEKVREELSNQLQSEIEEQKFLRLQKHLLLQNMMKTVLVLSEEELQQMMQSFLDVFCQMDKSLALPKLRERSILQAHMTDRRKAKMEKLELRWRKQDKLKAKEQGHGDQVKVVVLQERIRRKIKLYDGEAERAAEEVNKICAELFHQRANQMKDLEENLGVCMASIQLCRAERQVRSLETHTAILNLQALLLEEMATAGLQCEPACNQVVQEHISNLEQIIHLHSDKLQHELTVGTEQTEWNNWVEMQSRPLTEENTAQCSSQMLICLYQAMSKCKDTVEAESQRLRDEGRNSQLLEDVKGQLVVKTLLSLQDQELKLVAYLIQQLSIPVGVCRALLNLLLPNAIQEELTLFVNRIYAERNVSSGINKDKMDKQRKRKLWESLELKLRNKLIGENLGNMNVPCSRKGSILKKKRLQLLKQVSFSQSHGSSEFPPDDSPEPINEGAGQMLKMADTGEKVFVFRIKKEEPCSSDLPPKKKKRNFLNFKRSAVANLDEL